MNRTRPVSLRRTARGALVALVWTLVVLLVGARVAYFDEIRPTPSNATVSLAANAPG